MSSTKPLLILTFLVLIGCSSEPIDPDTTALPVALTDATSSSDEFGDYWYQGEAELTSYDLKQARYGEIHDGTAVLIFVTEDFSKDKQVKLDYPSRAGDDKINVLKLNKTKNFNTGIYPYSMMSSVFTPVHGDGYPRTLKVTTSSQEWCGHTYTQINRKRNNYHIEARSYFESEGDQDLQLKGAMLEDEIWTAIRLDPNQLPMGRVSMIPGTMYQRLGHLDFGVFEAQASMTEQEGDLLIYSISYPDLKRTLSISFSKTFPHEIEGWEETTTTSAGDLTTRASKKKRIMLDYWSRNGVADLPLRKDLGLD